MLLATPGAVRADAVRNAERILEVAAQMVDERGVGAVTMDAVAEAAGVGKGTIFRRFESRAGLMASLMNHTEMQFQQALMSGPPPLGPGASPQARLLAFGAARVDLVIRHGELMRARGERGHAGQVPAFDVAATHVRVLLRDAGVEGDLELLAGHLVNALDPGWVLVLTEQRDYSVARVLAGWESLVQCVLDTAEGQP